MMTTTVEERATLEKMSYRKAEKLMTEFATTFLKEEFGMELEIPITINPRLSSVYGKFFHRGDTGQPIKIEISKSLFEHNEKDFVLGTVKHELIHYALCHKGMPFRDGDTYFENTLKRLGAPSSGTRRAARKEEVYQCTECGHKFRQSRKLKHHKYYQGNNYLCECGGTLTYLGQNIPAKRVELVDTGYSYKG